MPEGLEAEIWCRSAQVLVGRTIVEARVDARVADAGVVDSAIGRRITSVRRDGKIVLIDTDDSTIGLHFGMTGRLEIDGDAPIERLEYASGADRPEWDRLVLTTDPAVDDRPAIRMNDPRRLGRVTLDPDTSTLGPDAFALTASQLGESFAGRRAAVKTLLLDQTVVAGLGNLCADEVLFWAQLAPTRPVDSLAVDEVEALAGAIRTHLPTMLASGGSTTGTLDPETRSGGARCPLDATPLVRSKVGGRTAVWCPGHQR